SRVPHPSSPVQPPLRCLPPALAALAATLVAFPAFAQEHRAGGEANLVLPEFATHDVAGINARLLLSSGLVVCLLGLGFAFWMYRDLENLPVHKSMLEIS